MPLHPGVLGDGRRHAEALRRGPPASTFAAPSDEEQPEAEGYGEGGGGGRRGRGRVGYLSHFSKSVMNWETASSVFGCDTNWRKNLGGTVTMSAPAWSASLMSRM